MYEQNYVERIEKSLAENKASVKTYATYEKCVAVAVEKAGGHITGMYGVNTGTHVPRPCEFIPVCIPSTGRWTPIFLFNSWIQANPIGGYIGHFAAQGFIQA